MLALYTDAITRMSQNPSLPQLFRDIFKNAYLPYRDPETLKLFLKTINEFNYDHSEKLGDAFEYLLSVLGSQGDAGQFRTPRHIIDFMVQVVDPRKNDAILDPACGTAGFLISAYKHIVRANTSAKHRSENGNNLGDLLKPDERKKLLSNFKGYDISPDMVRLSLVNLYLHGFVQPQILEYDTLTSEERWNEYADVIMANPPFMSPKGGIKPHKKFSVQSNRSEVLFVDYIAEHLRPTGRAAVIVPEGIIFQSAGAYKQLRKMLVEKYLYAVVSLPAGVFNPYSGVKTSIIFLDAQLAKKADSILFVKIENDGFGLGAQRREQVGSDLPDAANVIADYIKAVRSGACHFDEHSEEKSFNVTDKPCCAMLVEKGKLAENGEYNLTGERYRISKHRAHQKWPMVRIDDLFFEIKNGKNVEQFDDIGKYRVSRIQTISDGSIDLNKTKWTNDDVDESKILQEGDILLSHINSIDHLAKSAIFTNIHCKVVHGINLIRFRPDVSRVNPHFVARIFKSIRFIEKARSFAQKAVNQASIKTSDLKSIVIPLPPLEVQREIVAEIEGYQKLIDGSRQVVENWKPKIDIDRSWPMLKLRDVCERIMDGTHFSPSNIETGDQLYITAKNIKENGIDLSNISYITNKAHEDIYKRCPVIHGDVLYIKDGATAGIATINTLKQQFSLLSSVAVLRGEKNKLENGYLCFYLNSAEGKARMLSLVGGVAITRLTLTKINEATIPLPQIEVQREIVAKIEAERKAVDGCRELVAIYEAKIKRVIDKVWDE